MTRGSASRGVCLRVGGYGAMAMGVGGWADSPWRYRGTTGYGQQVDGTHPTGMHSCYILFQNVWILSNKGGLKQKSFNNGTNKLNGIFTVGPMFEWLQIHKFIGTWRRNRKGYTNLSKLHAQEIEVVKSTYPKDITLCWMNVIFDFFLYLFRLLVEFDEFYRIIKLSEDSNQHYSWILYRIHG